MPLIMNVTDFPTDAELVAYARSNPNDLVTCWCRSADGCEDCDGEGAYRALVHDPDITGYPHGRADRQETDPMTTDTAETWQDPDMALTADVVLFGEHDGQLYVLMITRRWDPFVGRRALPGGMVERDEEAGTAARRELFEETGLRAEVLTYVGAYSAPDRDPRGRYVSLAFTARLPRLQQPTAGDDAARAEWVLVDEVLAFGTELAFDHEQIIQDALRLMA